jgi:hypothetical protein
METLQLLGVALGLASLAGINLYLTVFVTGLAINQQWVVLAPQYQQLAVLGHPAIVAVAGVLYFIQFFADKIPWVDSLWDSIHTVIRPVGGALLAVHTLGRMNPVIDILAALVAGGAALTTHGLKAGTRLIVNTSPEPFSNIALSLTEDATVLGGLALIYYSPVLSLAVLFVFFGSVIYFAPKIVHSLKARLWLILRKLNAPASDKTNGELTTALPPDHDILFGRLNLLGEKIEWVAPCISTASRLIPSNCFGHLIATQEEPRKLYFVAKDGWTKIAEVLDLDGYKASQESKFLSENLVIYSIAKKPKFVFVFDRTKRGLVSKLTTSLQKRLSEEIVSTPLHETKVGETKLESAAT